VIELVQQRIAEIGTKISALNQLRHELEDVQQMAQALPDENILNKDCICHLIEDRALAKYRA